MFKRRKMRFNGEWSLLAGKRVYELRVKLLIKLRKFSNYDVISYPLEFFIFEKKIYFCPHIAESANTAENDQYRGFFWKKCRRYNIADIRPLPVLGRESN